MKERKDIDRLYQEKFKDFEATPKEAVWENIAAKLKEKDKKKAFVIPLWYKLGGVAAALAIIAGITYFLTYSTFNNTPEVVFEKPETENKKSNIPENSSVTDKTSGEAEELSAAEAESSNQKAKPQKNSNNSTGKTAIAAGNNTSAGNPGGSRSNTLNSAPKKAVVSNSKQRKPDTIQADPMISRPESVIADQESKNKENIRIKGSAAVAEIDENETDSLAPISEIKNNALAEAEENKKKEEEVIAETGKKQKLSISTFAAPVYYDNLGSGNPISSEFADNNSKGDITMAYGINVAYAISDKVKIRSGISKVSMSYNTNNVAFGPSMSPQGISSIDYNNNNNLDIRGGGIQAPGENSGFATSSFAMSRFEPGALNQQFGYIEIPVEIEYSIIDKKLGLNLIGGGSSLFLDENTIYLKQTNGSTKLGESNNIRNFSFSTNIGIGLDYDLNEQFRLNLEPIFKYQLNSFKGTQNVQPYYFGVYTGFSYKF